jgi:hypothetical protein
MRQKSPALRVVETIASALSRKAVGAPVDLAFLARHRRVVSIRLANIIPDGLTRPVHGGFEVYLRDSRDKRSDNEDISKLTYRQRFTLAHELAHTFYYDLAPEKPQLQPRIPRRALLERYCDVAASILLLPEHLLMPELARRAVTLQTLFELTQQFRASAGAVLRRIAAVRSGTWEDSAVLSVRSADDVIEVAFVPPRVLPILPHPLKFKTTAPNWCRSLGATFWSAPDRTEHCEIGGQRVVVRKAANHRRDGYFLEITPDA